MTMYSPFNTVSHSISDTTSQQPIKHLPHSRLCLALVLSGFLSACGGGGSEGGSNPPDNPTNPTNPTISKTAPLDTNELAVYNYLNQQRLQCGFKALNSNNKLNAAASNHSSYMVVNNTAGHYQQAGQPLFTGVSISDRMRFVGYDFVRAGEILSYGRLSTMVYQNKEAEQTRLLNDLPKYAVNSLKSLTAAPYHMLNAFGFDKDVGIGFYHQVTEPDHNALQLNYALTLKTASTDNTDTTGKDQLYTYPCQGSIDTATQLTNETPNPVRERDLRVDPVGQPIYLYAPKANHIRISNYKLVDAANQQIPLILLNQANDQHGKLKANQAFLIPDTSTYSPRVANRYNPAQNTGLKPNILYRLSYSISIDGGQMQAKTLTFKTGSAN